MRCPCCSEKLYVECCEPFHLAKAIPKTAEQLMRSRYSAYVLHKVDYIVKTTIPAQQPKLDFWFKETSPELWFKKDAQFDQTIQNRFSKTWQAATKGELAEWRSTIYGRLAEIIVLDQFSRHLHRDNPLAFAYDGMALALAQEATKDRGFYQLSRLEAGFLLMPYMHSESAFIHQQAEILFKNYGTDNNYQFELKHKVIIDRFGRYPHRNSILGRQSTLEEQEFLKQEGSAF